MGTEWRIIWSQLKAGRHTILLLMAVAISIEVSVLWNNSGLYIGLGGTIAMIPAAYLDGRYYRLYHRLTFGILVLGVLLSILLELFLPGNYIENAWQGMVCLGGMFLVLYLVTRQLGFGDVCYGAALGSFLGWQGAIAAFILTFVLGMAAVCLEYLYYLYYGRWRRRMLPLGPFMACGSYIVLLWGQELIGWYTGIG